MRILVTGGSGFVGKNVIEYLLARGYDVIAQHIGVKPQCGKQNGKIATITTTQPSGRFGGVLIEDGTNKVLRFKEKARTDQAWVNMGFMVLEPEFFDYLGDGSEMLEAGPFEKLVADGQMSAYRHKGFWMPMDNMRDREYLEGLWKSGQAPWKIW